MRRRLAAAAALCLLAAGCARSAPVVMVSVDPTERHQTMRGWEATAQAGQVQAVYDTLRDGIMELLADSLGVNRLRLEVRAGSEHSRDYWTVSDSGRLRTAAARCARYTTVNDNDDPRVLDLRGLHFTELDHEVSRVALPLRERLAARGERLGLTVTYVAFIDQCPAGTPFVHRDPEEYAEFALAVLRHLRERWGLVPDQWETVLEPDNNRRMGWSPESYAQLILAASRRFASDGFGAVRFIGPSGISARGSVAWFDRVVAVPGVLPLLGEFAYHRYRWPVTAGVLRRIAERSRASGVPSAMLEHIGSGVDDLFDDVAVARAAAWQQYGIAYHLDPDSDEPDDGGLYVRVRRGADGGARPVLAERSRLLRHAFLAGRTGAVRIGGASGDTRAVRVLAFENPGLRYGVALRTRRAVVIAVAGLPAGRYARRWTTRDTTGAAADTTIAAGDTLRLVVPGEGAASVIGLTPLPAAGPGADLPSHPR